jgi:hypothetical protein
MNIATAMKGSIVAFAVLMSYGCATNKQLEEVRAIATKAEQNAAAAQSSISSSGNSVTAATNTANEAKRAADAAQSTANQALQAAQAAQASADAANEKVDRAFKKSVSK